MPGNRGQRGGLECDLPINFKTDCLGRAEIVVAFKMPILARGVIYIYNARAPDKRLLIRWNGYLQMQCDNIVAPECEQIFKVVAPREAV